jgi:hypothetical protein
MFNHVAAVVAILKKRAIRRRLCKAREINGTSRVI